MSTHNGRFLSIVEVQPCIDYTNLIIISPQSADSTSALQEYHTGRPGLGGNSNRNQNNAEKTPFFGLDKVCFLNNQT